MSRFASGKTEYFKHCIGFDHLTKQEELRIEKVRLIKGVARLVPILSRGMERADPAQRGSVIEMSNQDSACASPPAGVLARFWAWCLGARPSGHHPASEPTPFPQDSQPQNTPSQPQNTPSQPRLYEFFPPSEQSCFIYGLPKYTLVRIAALLDSESLSSLRQASPFFETAVNDYIAFGRFHSELNRAPVPFSRMLHPESEGGAPYCDSCSLAIELGEFQPRMVNLRKQRFCSGCNKCHASLFFSQENIDRHERYGERLECIGRRGKIKVCSHAPPTVWSDLEGLDPKLTFGTLITCRSDKYERDDKSRCPNNSSSMSRMSLSSPYKGCGYFDITMGWDLPLIDIDPQDPPSTDAIQHAVQHLITGGAFTHHKPCRHMLDGEMLCIFATRAICDCFGKSVDSQDAKVDTVSHTCHECERPRQLFLTCEDCGAVYSWAVKSGRITLGYRYQHELMAPTDLSWLTLLHNLPALASIYHRENKHIFWCDSPGCSTARMKLRLWQDMAIEEMYLQESRSRESGSEKREGWHHFWCKQLINQDSFRIPPQLLDYDSQRLLEENVKRAASHKEPLNMTAIASRNAEVGSKLIATLFEPGIKLLLDSGCSVGLEHILLESESKIRSELQSTSEMRSASGDDPLSRDVFAWESKNAKRAARGEKPLEFFELPSWDVLETWIERFHDSKAPNLP